MTDPAMPADLDRVLSAASVPSMSAGLIDRIVTEAARPGRVALPPPSPRRQRTRWARRGMRTGIVAASLMLATAVAAAFGGGAPIFAKIAAVAHHVVQHIRHPFIHDAPVAAPVRTPVTHRMVVPPAVIRTVPTGGMPMAMPRALVGVPAMMHRQPIAPMPAIHAQRTMPVARPLHPQALGHDRMRPLNRPSPHAPAIHARPRRAPGLHSGMASHGGTEPHVPVAAPIVPRAEPMRESAPTIGAPSTREFGPRADGGQRTDEPRLQDPARATNPDGFRRPGWRRRQWEGGGMGVNPGANPDRNPPGWRRRAGMGAGARIKPPRPGGGRRRRF